MNPTEFCEPLALPLEVATVRSTFLVQNEKHLDNCNIAMKFVAHIQDHQKMTYKDSGDALTFTVAPLAGQSFHIFSVKGVGLAQNLVKKFHGHQRMNCNDF